MRDFLNKIIILLSILVIELLLNCSNKIAGAGSETTNGIVGSLINEDGTPATKTIVKLLPSDYDPVSNSQDTILIDTTDSEGKFKFSCVSKGIYSILARNYQHNTCFFKCSLAVKDNDSTVSIPVSKLLKGGIVKADFSGTNTNSLVSCYIYIPGSDMFSRIDSTGKFELKDVPVGEFSTIIYNDGSKKQNILSENIIVKPESTITITYALWKYKRYIRLNTTESGAGIKENLYGFPLLIRLNETNFEFSLASVNGDDIRFTKTNGTPLELEIERWDISKKCAEIWVKVDTVYANDSNQSIVMYWGNSEAVPLKKNFAVFDTVNGFSGVWHLGDLTSDSILDATNNHFNGISPSNASPAISEGIIGYCCLFDGSSYITIPGSADGALDFSQNDRYTVSAWVYIENLDGLSQVILSKGNFQYFLWLTPIHLNTNLWEFAVYRDVSGWDLAAGEAVSGEWIYLTGVRDGTTHRLYINGELAEEFIDFPFTENRNTDGDLMFGRFNQKMISPTDTTNGYCFFKGKIDEIRICAKARSSDWIKLCYVNQKKDNKLIIFK